MAYQTPYITRQQLADGRVVWLADRDVREVEIPRLDNRIDNIVAGGVTYVGRVIKVSEAGSGEGVTPTDGSTYQYYQRVGESTWIKAANGDLMIVPGDTVFPEPDKEFIWVADHPTTDPGGTGQWEEVGHEGQGAFAFVNEGYGFYSRTSSATPVHTATTTSFTGQYHNVTAAALAKQVVTGVTAGGDTFGVISQEGTLPSLTYLTKNIKEVGTITTATISIIDGVGTLPSIDVKTATVKAVNAITTTTISIIDSVGSVPTRESVTVMTGVDFNAGQLPTGNTTEISGLVSSWSAGTLPTKQAVTVVTSVGTKSVTAVSGITFGQGSLPTRQSVTVVTGVTHTAAALDVKTGTATKMTSYGALPVLTTTSNSNYMALSTTDTSLLIFYPIDSLVGSWSAGTLPAGTDLTVVTSASLTSGGGVTVLTKSIYEITGVGALPTLSSENVTFNAVTAVGTATISQITGVGTLPVLTTTTQTISEFGTQGSLPTLTPKTKDIYQITGVGSVPTKKAQNVVTAVTTNNVTAVTGVTLDPGSLPTKKAQEVVTGVGSNNVAAVTSITFDQGTAPSVIYPELLTGFEATKETVGITLTSSSATVTVSGKYDKTTSITLGHTDTRMSVYPYTPE